MMKNCDGDEEDKRDKLKSRALLQFSPTILAISGVDFLEFIFEKSVKSFTKNLKIVRLNILHPLTELSQLVGIC